MRKFSLSVLALAGLLFVACSDSSEMGLLENSDLQSELLPQGYMALNINLPTTSSTRAKNDDFDDGLADEYKVTDCALLLFEGANNEAEDDAKLLSAQAIVLPFDSEETDGSTTTNITTTYKATAKVVDFNNDGNHKLYALALLNYKEVMGIDNGLPTFKNIPASNSGTETVVKGSKMSAIRALITNANLTTRGGSTNYFFMTNAVLYKNAANSTAAPTRDKVIQLAEMDPAKIKENMDDAKLDPAGEIFVERAVAKATLRLENDNMKVTSEDLEIESVEWAIDNMEPSAYVLRNSGTLSYIGYSSGFFGANPYYRFVGGQTLYNRNTLGKPTDPVQLYRTYWCEDPQYSIDAQAMLAAPKYSKVGLENPLYCYENSFDVDHQNYKNTTRAVIKVTLKGNPTFYTINNNPDRYVNDAAGKGIDKATSHVVNYIVNKSKVLDAFENALNDGQEWNINETSVNVEYERYDINGQLKVKSIKVSQAVIAAIGTVFKDGSEAAINAVINSEELIAEINKEYVIHEYKDGVMYYEARFMHFAGAVPGTDDLAPWHVQGTTAAPNNWEGTVTSGGIDNSYPAGKDGKTKEENYLGRYGMVRNNWYDVVITSFNKLGYPADPSGKVNNPEFDEPDTPNTPDDNIQDYISAKIHVLSWAKRNQNWGF